MVQRCLSVGIVVFLSLVAACGCDLVPTSRAPRAVIDASPLRGSAPFVATFDASRSNDDGAIVAYRWAFTSEPAAAEGATCAHTFGAAGTHTVTLTVLDADGNIGTAEIDIVADNAPPIASLRLSDGAPIVKTLMTADGSGSTDPEGSVLQFYWDFGDGTTAEGAIATHAYESEGAYLVSLVVRDAAGAEATASHRVLVQTPPSGGCSGGRPIALR